MDAAQAFHLLQSLQPDVPDVRVTGGLKKDKAHLLLVNTHDPDRWAVVDTPGDRYFFVQTNTLYSKDYFEEDTSDDDVREILENHMKIAVAYVQGSGEVVRIGVFKIPRLIVEVGDRQEELWPSLWAQIRAPFKRSGA